VPQRFPQARPQTPLPLQQQQRLIPSTQSIRRLLPQTRRQPRPTNSKNQKGFLDILGITVEREALTGDQMNFQNAPIAYQPSLRKTINKRLTFKQHLPNGRKTSPLRTTSVHKRARSCAFSCDI
jgi:hypothetical protein